MKNQDAALGVIDALSTDTKALLLMIFSAFCFASMSAVIHALGSRIDWHLLVLFRTTFAFIITSSLIVRSGGSLNFSIPPTLWVRSTVGTAGMFATFYALTHLPVSDATVVIETRPVWVALLAAYVLGERTGGMVWIGIVGGIAGVAIIEVPYFAQGNYAVLIALSAAVSGGAAMVCLRKLASMDPRAIIAHFSAFATVAMLGNIALSDVPIHPHALIRTIAEPKTFLLLVGLGLFGTIGQLAMTKALSLSPAPRVATVGLAKVGIAAGYDVIFWGRVFTMPTIVGMVLILSTLGLLFNRKE